MRTVCNGEQLSFQALGKRAVVGRFDAGRTSSDGGVMLLRETAMRTNLFEKVASCFVDYRNPLRVEFSVKELVAQRILGLACGYEDLNDHDTLRDDALFALGAARQDVLGEKRQSHSDRGHALAGKSTLNRLELTPADASGSSRYKKVVYDASAFERMFVEHLIDAHESPPSQIILALDATDDLLHGRQEGRFFHGYYGEYCSLPLYIFCGEFLLVAKLRTSDRDGSDGALEEVTRLVHQIRARWPEVEIVLRADSGFAREPLMAFCEAQTKVHYVFGLAKNARLNRAIGRAVHEANEAHKVSGKAERRFEDLEYRTKNTWSRPRRVVAKAERIVLKDNPRFVVTSLPASRWDARALYEDVYCARGDMENRIKEQQLGLFADRTSCHAMRANQLRLWFSSLAYVLMNDLRRLGLANTELASAQVWTIRNRLLKLATVVRVSVRRVVLSFSSVFVYQRVFERVFENLQRRCIA